MNKNASFRAAKYGLAAAAVAAAGLASTSPVLAREPERTASVSSDTLTVVGSRKADKVALRLVPGDPTSLQVDFGDDGSAEETFARSLFSRINVRLDHGDDDFHVDQSNGAFADEAITVEAGAGDDTLVGGDGNEILNGGTGFDSVDGNRGADTSELGPGRDSFTWDPGDGSDTIDGNEGDDLLIFNGAAGNEVMSLSADGARSVFLRDLGNIRMDMFDVELLDVRALGGTDRVTINDMSGTHFRQAKVDLAVAAAPDTAADSVTVKGSARSERIKVAARSNTVTVDGFQIQTLITGSEAADQLVVNGAGGDDTAQIRRGLTALLDLTLDLS